MQAVIVNFSNRYPVIFIVRPNNSRGVMMKKVILAASSVIVFLFAAGCCKNAPKDSADQTRNYTTVHTNLLAGSLM